MIETHTVDLAGLGVRLPADRLAIVMSQPYLRLTEDEPFVTKPDAIPGQLAALARTLAVARGLPHHLDRTHLTVLPEYSIPGLVGVQALLDATAKPDWPNATIVMGGIHGLTKTEYMQLCAMQQARYAPENSPDHVEPTEWVNCSITLIKDSVGELHFWIQPKIWPAWEEQLVRHETMFRGRAINVFKGQLTNDLYFRLVSVICFDWIATVDAKAPIDWVVSALDASAGEAQLPLTWALVIQNNPKPSHRSFLGRIAPFFDQQRFPKVLRDNAALVFCNSAGEDRPAKTDRFGAASLLHSRRAPFQPSHNTPTVSKGGTRFRDGSDVLGDFNDSFFRERGACIHAFTLNNPASLPNGPPGRAFAVDDARVFSFDGPCPRAPNGPVEASVKWLHDLLDGCSSIGLDLNEAALAALADQAHLLAVEYLRALDGRSVSKIVEVASGSQRKHGADDWCAPQELAVLHLANTLDILVAASSKPQIRPSGQHAGISIEGTDFDVLALYGRKHEDCLERAKWEAGAVQSQLLFVTRDQHNTRFNRKHDSFLDEQHSGENRFTFPGDSVRVVGFQDLLHAFLEAPDQSTLAAQVKELLK